MTPEFKREADAVCLSISEEANVDKNFVSALINAQMLVAKLSVFGSVVIDKKINTRKTCETFIMDLTSLCFDFAKSNNIPPEKTAAVIDEVAKQMRPLLETHYGTINNSTQKVH